jgi:hypothetical protein
MKPYLSLWSVGYYKNLNQEKRAFLLNCYKMSAFFLLKHYKEVHLITDFEGAYFLKNIPFTSVDTSLEILPKKYDIMWSLGKLYTYQVISERGDPFFHIDSDVFLVNKLNESFLKEKVFVQHEEFYAFYEYQIKELFNIVQNKHLLGKILPDNAYNFGIFGGNDVEFINKFAIEALKLPLDNYDIIGKHCFKFHHTPACAIEQYQFSIFCSINNIIPKTLIDLSDRKEFNNKENEQTVESRARDIKYFHFWNEKFSNKRTDLVDRIQSFGNTIYN